MHRTYRNLFATLSFALGQMILSPLVVGAALTAQHTPEEALNALQDGNRRYASDRSVPQPIGEGVRRTLARGQSPIAVVVTCADSRVPPEHLFNTGLGELIVVRTAGHVIGPEAIATIEHAAERLNVPLCVVLGHEGCDVVTAAIDQVEEHGDNRLSPAVVQLLERIEPAVRKAHRRDLEGKPLHDLCEEEHTHATVAECMRRSPLLRRFASVGKFKMVPARYHSDGEVEWLPVRPLPQPEQHRRRATLGAVPTGLPPHVALRMLRAGHRRFLGDRRPPVDLTRQRREQLADGEQPLAIVVTDSDSRVSPELVFDAGIGELYVVRIAGNTLTDETLASIEFAAGRLGASLLVVMGNNRCEPIAAAADHPEQQQLTPNLRKLLTRLEPVVQQAKQQHAANLVELAAQENAVRTLREARSRSALLRALEDQGRFAMLAACYDVATGDLHWLKGDATTQPTAHAPATDGHDGEHDHGLATHGQEHGDSHADAHADPHADPHAGGHGETTGAHHDDLPVVDLHAAPLGETGPGDGHADHGHDAAHGESAGHGEHEAHSADHGHGSGHGHDAGHGAHGEGHASEDAHGSHGSHEESHDAHAGHAAADDHGSHGSHGAHDGHDGHDGHGEHGEHGAHDPHQSPSKLDELLARWLDPVVVVGMTGIASLLLAAVIALKNRG